MSSVNSNTTSSGASSSPQPEGAPGATPPVIFLPCTTTQKLIDQRSKELVSKSSQLESVVYGLVSPDQLQGVVDMAVSGVNEEIVKEQLDQAEQRAENIFLVVNQAGQLFQDLLLELEKIKGAYPKPKEGERRDYSILDREGLGSLASSLEDLKAVVKKCNDVLFSSLEELECYCRLLMESGFDADTVAQKCDDQGLSVATMQRLGLVYTQESGWKINQEGLLPKLQAPLFTLNSLISNLEDSVQNENAPEKPLEERVPSRGLFMKIWNELCNICNWLLSLFNRLYDHVLLGFFFFLKRLGIVSGGPRPLSKRVPVSEVSPNQGPSQSVRVKGRQDLGDDELVRRPEEDSSGAQQDSHKQKKESQEGSSPKNSRKRK
ncbi:hypothetical protein CpecG_0500 [Chlamydia pecorum MC/MarsBar]|uniref:CT392 family protein n=1 Tax=Chlamydia pecorum TaxID=85991 RepID=UPI0003D3FA8D|nr:hypothetical protein [Chlamydia pecorum]ETF40075.1 hypothetical protein CpecG_0500 [Chlamydia pecorum MC/MarsBar]UBV32082.1 hypothetical protein MarsBar_0521 [Chlamydia pecorum]